MNEDRQYLFPSSASHFFSLLWAVGLLGASLYDWLSGPCTILCESNVSMNAIMVFLLLSYTSMIEACMMIKARGYLFAYNVDKAICVPIKDGDVKSAVSVGCTLFGSIFDKNCESLFAPRPKSPITRKSFYIVVLLLFLESLIAPCYYSYRAFLTQTWTSNLIVAWVFAVMDGVVIVNRVFFRASIRRFWAFTLGDANFRSILRFELSGEDAVVRSPFVVDSLEDENQQD